MDKTDNSHHCIKCGNIFYVSTDHEKWLADRNMKVPDHCPGCRTKKKYPTADDMDLLKKIGILGGEK